MRTMQKLSSLTTGTTAYKKFFVQMLHHRKYVFAVAT